MYVAKTKALISFAVTAKLICIFVLAYAKKIRFSHNEAQVKHAGKHVLVKLTYANSKCADRSVPLCSLINNFVILASTGADCFHCL